MEKKKKKKKKKLFWRLEPGTGTWKTHVLTTKATYIYQM